MSASARPAERPGLVRQLVDWWHDLGIGSKRATLPDCCHGHELEPLAQKGASCSDLRVLAGKWPNATAALLAERGNNSAPINSA